MTTPTDQQFYDALAPDLKRKVDENRAMQARRLQQREGIERIQVRPRAALPRAGLGWERKLTRVMRYRKRLKRINRFGVQRERRSDPASEGRAGRELVSPL